jgi:hypothetical protein
MKNSSVKSRDCLHIALFGRRNTASEPTKSIKALVETSKTLVEKQVTVGEASAGDRFRRLQPEAPGWAAEVVTTLSNPPHLVSSVGSAYVCIIDLARRSADGPRPTGAAF